MRKNIVYSMLALGPIIGVTQDSIAQVNVPGRFQLSLGASFGGHATHFEGTAKAFGFTFVNTSDDGAVTVAAPLDVQVGFAQRWSGGIYLEPGSYIDSAGTHPNGFFLAGLSPRFYAINGDHFALLINADIGVGVLRIGDVESGTSRYDDTYAGAHFRLGSQVQWYFGNTFGIHAGVKFAAHNLIWRDRDPEDPVLNALDYEAKLRTSGVHLELGLQVKL